MAKKKKKDDKKKQGAPKSRKELEAIIARQKMASAQTGQAQQGGALNMQMIQDTITEQRMRDARGQATGYAPRGQAPVSDGRQNDMFQTAGNPRMQTAYAGPHNAGLRLATAENGGMIPPNGALQGSSGGGKAPMQGGGETKGGWVSRILDMAADGRDADSGSLLGRGSDPSQPVSDFVANQGNQITHDFYASIGHPEWDPTFGGTQNETGEYLPTNLGWMVDGQLYQSGLSYKDTKALVAEMNAEGRDVEMVWGAGQKPLIRMIPRADAGASATGNYPNTTSGGDTTDRWWDDPIPGHDGWIPNQPYTPGNQGDPSDFGHPDYGTEDYNSNSYWNPSSGLNPNNRFDVTAGTDEFFRNLLKGTNLTPEEKMQLFMLGKQLGLSQQQMEDQFYIAMGMMDLEGRKVDMAGELNDAQIDILNRQRDIADMSIEEYKEYGGPKVAEFLSRRPESLDYAAQRAAGGIQQQYESGMGQATRRLQGMGVDPSSGQYQALLQEGYGPALAAAKVGAMTSARDKQRAANLGLLTDQANLARGQQATGIGALAQAGATASGGLGLLSGAGQNTAAAGGALQAGNQAGMGALSSGMGMAGDWMQNYLKSQQLMQGADQGGASFGISAGPFSIGR